ncbi:MAG TPA: PVC-type heme-binding CxxCH protein, partial [Pirellulales bacterium]|nr:PVC-type heme-binding CxxCH protein [Pirellulales bacterium]
MPRWLLVSFVLSAALAQRLTADDFSAPPLSPADALKSFVLHDGFEIELVAAEPLVMDPVAIAWDPRGRLWVAEMADYPLGVPPFDAEGNGKPGGRVRVLDDPDGDGRYDRSTLFLDGLNFPNGVLPYRNGALVTAAPEIFYAEDTDGDGRADRRVPLFVGFAEGNQQHRVNGLRWGLDNWIHCANGDSAGKIRAVNALNGKPIDDREVDIRGYDFRIRPDTGEIDLQTGWSQFGRDHDDWGNWFGTGNSRPLTHYVLPDEYLRRNRWLVAPRTKVEVPEAPGAAPIFPVSKTVARFNDLDRANRITSACGACFYRDELFGPAFAGNSFVCEPVHNLVHREIVEPAGPTFTSHRAPEEQKSEFLASADNWFRPVMVRTGPDGALWIVDMYRLVIEHPKWIPQDWQKRLDVRAGHDRGRIYRVFPKDKRPRPFPINVASVEALDHPSGTVRDLAQQSLVSSAPPSKSQVDQLEALAIRATRPQTRLQALAALSGLEQTNGRT